MPFPLQPPRVALGLVVDPKTAKVIGKVECSREWYLYFLGNRNETISGLEDGESSLLGIGAEETKHLVYQLADSLSAAESQINQLREIVAAMKTQIEGLEQS